MTDTLALLELLPDLYRTRDADRGHLEALLEILAEQARIVSEDVGRLWDDAFIETCAPWIVPYIGDLIGVPGVPSTSAVSGRAYVANTIGYRRRKGTVAVLEQLARDITGWPAKAVEFFRLLGTTQYLNHLRPANVRTPDLRDADRLELLDGPFATAARTAEVRSPDAPGLRGRFNIPHVGLYLWRIGAYSVRRAKPRAVAAGGYTFDPAGRDVPLFHDPVPEPGIEHLAGPDDVPDRLRRRGLRAALGEHRRAVAGHRASPPDVAFAIEAGPRRLLPREIVSCHLEDWREPPAFVEVPVPSQGAPAELPDGVEVVGDRIRFPIVAGVDPVLGRLRFADDPAPVRVSFAYGAPADVGGGAYDRRDGVDGRFNPDDVTFQVGVAADPEVVPTAPDEIVPTLGEAVQRWNDQADAGGVGLIVLMDSSTYAEDLTGAEAVRIPSRSLLLIVAGAWPVRDGLRRPGDVSPEEPLRPHLLGRLSVRGTASGTDPDPGTLIVSGLLAEGPVTVLNGNLGRLGWSDATIVPGSGSLHVNGANHRLRIEVDRSVVGTIDLPADVGSLRIADSIVGGNLDAPGAAAELPGCTIFGSTSVRDVEADDCLFVGPLRTQLQATGCVRYSFLADGSATPRRFRCQPDLGLRGLSGAEADRRRRSLQPAFVSVEHGHPGYAQLAATTDEAIRAGAEGGTEMGAYRSLHQPQREAHLRAALDEYLRAGLRAGIFHVT